MNSSNASSISSGSGNRGWVSIAENACPSTAVVAIRSAIMLDGSFDGSTPIPGKVGIVAR